MAVRLNPMNHEPRKHDQSIKIGQSCSDTDTDSSHIGHNRIATYSAAALAVLRAFEE